MKALVQSVDHIVYATPDLESTLRRIEAVFGVKPALGGQHRAWGTRNALLSLGPQTYLEIMGPDVTSPESGESRPFGLDKLIGSRFVTWVARSDDLQSVVSCARHLGVDLGDILQGSRKRPDGLLLKWSMTDLSKYREGGVVPYFIDWGESPHPAEGAPKGCRIVSIRAYHPEAERIRGVLASFGLDLDVQVGAKTTLEAVIETPNGEIELT